MQFPNSKGIKAQSDKRPQNRSSALSRFLLSHPSWIFSGWDFYFLGKIWCLCRKWQRASGRRFGFGLESWRTEKVMGGKTRGLFHARLWFISQKSVVLCPVGTWEICLRSTIYIHRDTTDYLNFFELDGRVGEDKYKSKFLESSFKYNIKLWTNYTMQHII